MNIDNGERRYYVTKLAEKIRGEDYWKPKWDWWNKENGAAKVLNHLMKLKIDRPDMYKGKSSDYRGYGRTSSFCGPSNT